MRPGWAAGAATGAVLVFWLVAVAVFGLVHRRRVSDDALPG
ncbi:hypothetical protein ACWDV4_05890 [Micromonospora sp. NPDC003197]